MFKSWILSIVGGIVLTILIDILLHEGETKKYIKGITSLIIFAIIIAPIPQLLNSSSNDLNSNYAYSNDNEAKVNQQFIYDIKSKELDYTASHCERYFDENGLIGLIVEPNLSHESQPELISVVVDKKNLCISQNIQNININEEIQNKVSLCFYIDKSKVIILE